MPNFIVREKGANEDKSFSEDFIAFNKDYIYGDKLADNFKVSYANNEILVDLTNGKIYVNAKEVDLGELPNGLKDFRPVNFKRNKCTIGIVNGNMSSKVSYGAGWQVTKDGVNYQRFILMDEHGLWTLQTKR
jgi:hypothetical protein